VVNGAAVVNTFNVFPLAPTPQPSLGRPCSHLGRYDRALIVDGRAGPDSTDLHDRRQRRTIISFTPGPTANSGTIDARLSALGGRPPLHAGELYQHRPNRMLTFAHAGGAAIDDLTVNGTSDSDTFAVSETRSS